MDKEKRQEHQCDEDGEMTVHQQITESYQSGVVDRLAERQPHEKQEKEK